MHLFGTGGGINYLVMQNIYLPDRKCRGRGRNKQGAGKSFEKNKLGWVMDGCLIKKVWFRRKLHENERIAIGTSISFFNYLNKNFLLV